MPIATYYTFNKLEGEAWGVELASDWQMLDWWRWRGTYTFYELNLSPTDGGTDYATIALLEGNAPQHQFSLRAQMNLTKRVDFDLGLRFVDELENPHVPAYATIDARLAWRLRPNLELSLVGLNLIEPADPEFRCDPSAHQPTGNSTECLRENIVALLAPYSKPRLAPTGFLLEGAPPVLFPLRPPVGRSAERDRRGNSGAGESGQSGIPVQLRQIGRMADQCLCQRHNSRGAWRARQGPR
ncbi:MAG: TonB-dependent receptor [Verrucomicrobiota bacterium]